jgi:hypothetical protein
MKVPIIYIIHYEDKKKHQLIYFAGLVTVKYIYGPSNAGAAQDAVIGSSISGRLESNIGVSRLTTIAMPLRGNYAHSFHE